MFPTRRITMGGDVFRDEHSLSFDGTNQYVAIDGLASTDVLTEDDGWAIGCWFKATQSDTNAAEEMIFSMNGIDSTNRPNIIRIGVNPNTTGDHVIGGIFFGDGRVDADQTGAIVLTDSDDPDLGTSYTDGNWHHLVVTRASEAGWQNAFCYVDGNLQGYAWNVTDGAAYNSGTFRSDPNWGSAELASFGQEWDNGPDATDFFKGNISEAFVYNTTLTSSQVATIYNGREPYNHKEGVASGNLQAWYRMGDGLENNSGTTIYDMSDNSNNGTMTNMAADDFIGDTP